MYVHFHLTLLNVRFVIMIKENQLFQPNASFFLSLLSMLPAKFNSAGLSAHRCNLFDPTIPTLPEFMWSFLHIYFKKLLARNVHHAYIDCLYYLAYLL